MKRKPGRPALGKAKRDQMIRPLFTAAELRAIDAYVNRLNADVERMAKREAVENITRHTPATWLRELALGRLAVGVQALWKVG